MDGWIYGAQGSTVSASVKSVMSKNKIDPVNSMGQIFGGITLRIINIRYLQKVEVMRLG